MNMSLNDLASYATVATIPLTIILWLVTRELFMAFWKRWWRQIGVVAVLLTLVGLYRTGWLNWLGHRVALPVYGLLLVPVIGLAVIWFILWLATAVKSKSSSSTAVTAHLSYVSDNIFGIQWKWDYTYGKLLENTVSAFCPEPSCRCRLVAQRRSMYHAVDWIELVCPHCGFHKEFEKNWQQLVHLVLLEVERRINTGEFRSGLNSGK
jgi:hypothetical protein